MMAEALATRTDWARAMHSSPQKSPGASKCDGGFFACPGDHAEPDAPALDVKNVFSRIALGKGPLFVGEMNNRSAQAAGS